MDVEEQPNYESLHQNSHNPSLQDVMITMQVPPIGVFNHKDIIWANEICQIGQGQSKQKRCEVAHIPWESVRNFINGEQNLEIVHYWFFKRDGRMNIHLTNPCKNSYSKWHMYVIYTHGLFIFMQLLMLWNFHDLTNFMLACRYHH
jgi:hypothetical protein